MTHLTPPVTALCETLMNHDGRFRTLRGLSPVLDATGTPIFRVGSTTVNFEVHIDSASYVLRIPYGTTARSLEAASRHAAVTNHESPLCECRYLRSELLVFMADGNAVRMDAILERIPRGVRLKEFIRTNLHSQGRKSIRQLLDSYAAVNSWFEKNASVHGHIRHRDIFVEEDGTLKIANRIHCHEYSCDADRTALIELSLLTYVVGCEPRVFQSVWSRRTPEERQQLLHAIKLQSEFSRQPRLTEICTMLAEGRTPDAAQTDAMLHDIASARFIDMSLLYGLLYEPQETETVTAFPAIPDDTVYRTLESAGPQSGGILRCRNSRGLWSYETCDGVRIGGEYVAAGDFYEGRAAVATTEGCGLLDSNGNYVMPPEYEMLEWYGPENIAVASRDGCFGLYDRMGRTLTGLPYDWIGEPSEGKLAVRRGASYGYITTAGVEATELKYTEAYSYRNGMALVESNGQQYFIDHDGRRSNPKK